MTESKIITVDDAKLKLINNIEIIMENAECVFLIKEQIKEFKHKYPESWDQMKDYVVNEILNYYDFKEKGNE